MVHRFTVFVDESGCEGFTFRDPPKTKGSSDWFVVSAVITMSSEQNAVINFARRIRETIGIAEKKPLHWTDLNHERRVRVYTEMVSQNFRYVSVLINKRAIQDPEVFKPRGRLYYYAVRLLLERVSWLCRDTAVKHGFEGREAKVIFEHKKRLKPRDMIDYVTLLQQIGPQDGWIAANQEDIRIEWDVISGERMQTAQKHQFAGLQVADMVASGLRSALENGPYGHTEHRYAKSLIENTYNRVGNYQSYGFKFFPKVPASGSDGMHWFYKHCTQ
jgi:hypothetical protein